MRPIGTEQSVTFIYYFPNLKFFTGTLHNFIVCNFCNLKDEFTKLPAKGLRLADRLAAMGRAAATGFHAAVVVRPIR